MIPAQSYRNQITRMGLDHMRLEAGTAEEATALLVKVRALEKELRN